MKQNRLGRHQREIMDKLEAFGILWGDDFNYPQQKRALKSLIKRGLLTFTLDDDNGGSIEKARD